MDAAQFACSIVACRAVGEAPAPDRDDSSAATRGQSWLSSTPLNPFGTAQTVHCLTVHCDPLQDRSTAALPGTRSFRRASLGAAAPPSQCVPTFALSLCCVPVPRLFRVCLRSTAATLTCAAVSCRLRRGFPRRLLRQRRTCSGPHAVQTWRQRRSCLPPRQCPLPFLGSACLCSSGAAGSRLGSCRAQLPQRDNARTPPPTARRHSIHAPHHVVPWPTGSPPRALMGVWTWA